MLNLVCRERKLNRLRNWDYTTPGWYFVTICTKNREPFFGDILNNTMKLNKQGHIIIKQWIWLKDRYKYVKLDDYVVMPNHFHGIIIINDGFVYGRDRSRPVPTVKIKSISELIGAFKTTSSKIIH